MKAESVRWIMSRSTRRTEDDGIQLCQDPMLRMPSLLRFTEEQVLCFLKRIQCKVLLIRAQSGWPFDPQMMKERIGSLSDYETRTIEGYHHVHMDEAVQVSEIVAGFLTRDKF